MKYNDYCSVRGPRKQFESLPLLALLLSKQNAVTKPQLSARRYCAEGFRAAQRYRLSMNPCNS